MKNIKIIAEKRKELALSQAELAKKIGVTQGTVSQWELGITKPSTDKLIELSKILKCKIEELLKGGE